MSKRSERDQTARLLREALAWRRAGDLKRARDWFAWAKESLYDYSVLEWGSHPDLGNDDCWTGSRYRTLAEAQTAFNSDGPWDARYVELDGPDVYALRKIEGGARVNDNGDEEWRREIAMQAGMGGGVDAYNEVMGWD